MDSKNRVLRMPAPEQLSQQQMLPLLLLPVKKIERLVRNRCASRVWPGEVEVRGCVTGFVVVSLEPACRVLVVGAAAPARKAPETAASQVETNPLQAAATTWEWGAHAGVGGWSGAELPLPKRWLLHG